MRGKGRNRKCRNKDVGVVYTVHLLKGQPKLHDVCNSCWVANGGSANTMIKGLGYDPKVVNFRPSAPTADDD
jgi:hypothetical protein